MNSQKVIWTSQEYHSRETCFIEKTETGFQILSHLSGSHQNKNFEVDYALDLDSVWNIQSGKIDYRFEGDNRQIIFHKDTSGNWIIGDMKISLFRECTSIDISLTPFTNTLAIKALDMEVNESKVITVIYFDILKEKITRKSQNYSRLSPTRYKFENIPNDFEAAIEVDNNGLVINYPGLFTRDPGH